jgi:hypothetical protein
MQLEIRGTKPSQCYQMGGRFIHIAHSITFIKLTFKIYLFEARPPRIISFICLLVLLQPREHKKLEPYSRLCCFLCYGETQKGYRHYDPIAHCFRISCHVVFWEHRLFTKVSQFRSSFSVSYVLDILPDESSNTSPEVLTLDHSTKIPNHTSGSSFDELPPLFCWGPCSCPFRGACT